MYASGTLSLAAMTNPNETENPKHRRIRSFVLRTGRQTAAQRRALKELWPDFGFNIDNQTIDLTTQFGRVAPIVMEIGFGNGENIAAMAKAAPEKNFLGIEVHEPGVGM